MKNIDKNNVGNAGEYYICSILSCHNFITTITLGRAEKYDIIGLSQNGKGRTVKISVKTRFEKTDSFILSNKDEIGGEEDGFYAFVCLNKLEKEPDFWIMPSKVVNHIVYIGHKTWLEGNSSRKDSSMRKLSLIGRPGYPVNWQEQITCFYKNIQQLV